MQWDPEQLIEFSNIARINEALEYLSLNDDENEQNDSNESESDMMQVSDEENTRGNEHQDEEMITDNDEDMI